MKTLVLNSTREVLGVKDFQGAICDMVKGNVEVLASYDKTISSPSLTLNVPAVIARKQYRYIQFDRLAHVNWSKGNVLRRDDYRCQYCGAKLDSKLTQKRVTTSPRLKRFFPTIDHVQPQCLGGPSTWGNTVAACGRCNSAKDARTLSEADMKLRRKPGPPRGFVEVVRIRFGVIDERWKPYLYEF